MLYWFQNGRYWVRRGSEDAVAIIWDDPKQYQQDGETEDEFLSRQEREADRAAWDAQDQ
jgi:hypothetical protein